MKRPILKLAFCTIVLLHPGLSPAPELLEPPSSFEELLDDVNKNPEKRLTYIQSIQLRPDKWDTELFDWWKAFLPEKMMGPDDFASGEKVLVLGKAADIIRLQLAGEEIGHLMSSKWTLKDNIDYLRAIITETENPPRILLTTSVHEDFMDLGFIESRKHGKVMYTVSMHEFGEIAEHIEHNGKSGAYIVHTETIIDKDGSTYYTRTMEWYEVANPGKKLSKEEIRLKAFEKAKTLRPTVDSKMLPIFRDTDFVNSFRGIPGEIVNPDNDPNTVKALDTRSEFNHQHYPEAMKKHLKARHDLQSGLDLRFAPSRFLEKCITTTFIGCGPTQPKMTCRSFTTSNFPGS